MSNDVTALFNGSHTLQLVQGEDVAVAVSLRGTQLDLPFDLTSTDFTIAFVGTDDRTIRRSSIPLALNIAATSANGTTVTCPQHGMVPGDVVVVSGTGLPAPLVNATNYAVSVLDEDTFSIIDNTSALPIVFTSVATAPWQIAVGGVSLAPPLTSGIVQVILNANFTANIKAGIGQTFQIETIKNGQTHIFLEMHDLDVYEQV